MRSRKNYADWSYQARTNRVKIVGCPNAENRWPDWTVFLFSAFLCWFVWRYVVSIHAPTRGATVVPFFQVRDALVSIHAPTRGATAYTARRARCHYGFNPRPREGSAISSRGDERVCDVSIHAPTRGATAAGL